MQNSNDIEDKTPEELKGIDIPESWFWSKDDLQIDLEEAREKVNDINRKIRRLDKERKLQPPLNLAGIYTGIHYLTTRYQIIDLKEGKFCAEQKVQVTDDENVKI